MNVPCVDGHDLELSMSVRVLLSSSGGRRQHLALSWGLERWLEMVAMATVMRLPWSENDLFDKGIEIRF